jgi:group I intron endonuclease
MKAGVIYKITNKINGKSYIGQTKYSASYRLQKHLVAARKQNTILYKAFKKYGAENFEISELLSVLGGNDLDYFEKLFVDFFDTFNCGYNMTEGGCQSHLRHAEIGKKISASKKGVRLTNSAHNAKNLVGTKKNKLTAVERQEYFRSNGTKAYRYLCKCDCGNTKIVDSSEFSTNHVKSCGCLAPVNNPKTYVFRCPNGQRVEIVGLRTWCRQNKFNHRLFLSLHQRRIHTAKGYTLWERSLEEIADTKQKSLIRKKSP